MEGGQQDSCPNESKDDRKTKKSSYILRAQEQNQDLGELMDVDSRDTKQEKTYMKSVRNYFTNTERTDFMKCSTCFKCKQVRHLSRDCPGQGRNNFHSDSSRSQNE